MEVIAYIEAEETVRAVLSGVLRLIHEILRAREDVRTLPKDVDALLEVVDGLRPVIDKIQTAGITVQDQEVLSSLQRLGQELTAALETVDAYEKKEQKEKERHEVWKFAKALFQHGAAKQRKEIGAIRMAIAREHENLTKALTAGTYKITVKTSSTVESTHSIVEDTAGNVLQVKRSLEALLARPDPSLVIKEPSIIAALDRRADECLDSESYCVDLLRSDKNDFSVPTPKYQSADDAKKGGDSRRGAREGGVEVNNYTKLQFHIEVQNKCYLYIFSFEKGLPTATNLEVIFPKHPRCENKMIRNRIRKFPDQNRYKRDPLTLKLEKSALLKDWVQAQVLLYVVLSDQLLAPDGSDFEEGIIVQQLIMSNLSSEDTTEDIYVKRFLFDVS